MTSILLVDDHTMLRQCMAGQLAAVAGFSVAGEAGNGPEALGLAYEHSPDVVVMDISLPGMNGVETTRRLRAGGFAGAILGLTVHVDGQLARRALEAGMNGYGVKEDTFEDLVYAIRTVTKGTRYLSPLLLKEDGESFGIGPATPAPPHEPETGRLTLREREVVSLVAAGYDRRAIATRLHISPRTVEAHRSHIAEKTGLRRIADLTRFAVRNGLVGT